MKLVVVEGSWLGLFVPARSFCVRPLCRLLASSTWLPVEQGLSAFLCHEPCPQSGETCGPLLRKMYYELNVFGEKFTSRHWFPVLNV